jgi:PhnB protein
MAVQLNPYLSFRDNARAALEFYQSVFGGELTISTFGDLGMQVEESEVGNVMHGMLIGDNGIVLMGADTPAHMEMSTGSSISVSLSGDDADLLTGFWTALSTNGTVTVPLEKAPWGDSFGMCTDSFGTDWLVNISGTPEG